jgi:hypothetical protein
LHPAAPAVAEIKTSDERVFRDQPAPHLWSAAFPNWGMQWVTCAAPAYPLPCRQKTFGEKAMTNPNDGGPAFPRQDERLGEVGLREGSDGMTLRDWFAGQALAACVQTHNEGFFDGGDKAIAECAYDLADAMLAAREVKP